MNTAQLISASELAEHLAIIQPSAIASRLLNDPKFRADFGLPIRRSDLLRRRPSPYLNLHFISASALYLPTVSPGPFFALNGQEIRTELKDQYVLISFTGEDGTTLEVWIRCLNVAVS